MTDQGSADAREVAGAVQHGRALAGDSLEAQRDEEVSRHREAQARADIAQLDAPAVVCLGLVDWRNGCSCGCGNGCPVSLDHYSVAGFAMFPT